MEKIMDKIRSDKLATKKEVLSKINQLVEGYNEIIKKLNGEDEEIRLARIKTDDDK